MPTATIQKVTVSLPRDLVIFADTKAAEWGITRSGLFAELLADLKNDQEDALAAEGYQFYAQEAEEFAQASQGAVSEAWSLGS